MITPAYDECYLDSMIKKHRYLFKLIGRYCEHNAFDIIDQYLCCEYRKRMDEGNPLYLNKTPKQILGEMGIEVGLVSDISEVYDEFILAWMADIYTYMSLDVNDTGGLVYGSYQHAGSSVTLSQSKNYSFSINGYGNVFLFNTTKAKDAYDGMDGVSMYV